MLVVLLLTSTLLALAGARVYGRCELARDLLRLGVPRDQVSTWVCIAFHESRFDTTAWNTYSGDHGLLQISELYWCGPGKACGVPCSSLRDSDITDDVKCALKIYREHTRLQGNGFMAWVVYPQFCRGSVHYLKDCNRLGKSYSENLPDKLDVLNSTAPHFVDNDNVNQPLPGYLAINSLIQEIDFEKFERDYYNINKRKFDWQNFKIDNIDELKLPVANRRDRLEFATSPTATFTPYTTITTARTTTALEPALIGIKPPAPRQIESNQFRRRKMKLEQEPSITDNFSLVTTSIVLPTTYSTTAPRFIKVLPLQSINGHDSPLNKTSTIMKTSINTTITPQTTLQELASQTLMKNSLPLTAIVKPSTGTTLRTTEEVNYENFNYKGPHKPTTEPTTTRTVTPRKRNETFRDFTFYSSPLGSTTTPRTVTTPYVPEVNKSRVIEVTTKEPKYYFSHSTYNRLPKTIFQTPNSTQRISLSNTNTNKTSAKYLSEITSTIPSIINISVKSNEHVSTVNTTNSSSDYEIGPNIVNNTLKSTTISQTRTGQSFVIKTQPSAQSRYSQPTTLRPIFTSSSSQTTKLNTGTSTTSSTHSIFDLYLNPTIRPTLQPFSFAPFNKNPFRVRIFSGGTTPLPSGKTEDSKTFSFIKK